MNEDLRKTLEELGLTLEEYMLGCGASTEEFINRVVEGK